MVRCTGCRRRPSLHEKNAMSTKDARDEATHVLEMMAAVDDDDDDDSKDEAMAASRDEVVRVVHCNTLLLETLT